MATKPPDIHDWSAGSLDLLMSAAECSQTRWWTDDELEPILKHQLSAPPIFDLREIDGLDATAMQTESAAEMPSTFGTLLFDPDPPLSLLVLMKEFAKMKATRSACPLPPEVATVLYYGAIVAARLRCQERISSLSDADLHGGLLWAMDQKWIDARTKSLFQEGLERLSRD